MNAIESKNAEKADFFPFVSGELLEEHRKHLNKQMRSEIQQYMTAKSMRRAAHEEPHQKSKSAMSQDPRKTVGSQHSFMRNSQDMAQS